MESRLSRSILLRALLTIACLAAWPLLHAQLPPPIADADPTIRHEVTLCLSDKLDVERTDTTLSIAFDKASLQNVKVTVGKNMVMGMKYEERVYAVGDPRPDGPSRLGMSSGVGFCTAEERARSGYGTETLNRSQGGIPAERKKYIVERDLTIFETDIPAQHIWPAQASKKYKALWSGTLKTVD